MGIESQYWERIFVLFQRCTDMRQAICREVVERHGGRMWVESAPGQASVFWSKFPATA
jgi:light-regulated signal transduction histidine kinase (bacteriophytochrome)